MPIYITTTTDNHAHKYQYKQNSAKMQLFPKHWELLVTPHAPTSLMLCMVNCHLYANAGVYALRTCQKKKKRPGPA